MEDLRQRVKEHQCCLFDKVCGGCPSDNWHMKVSKVGASQKGASYVEVAGNGNRKVGEAI